MKILFTGLLLVLAGCGDYPNLGTGKNSVGEIKQLTSTDISGTELSRFVSVCNALQTLELGLGDALNSIHPFSYTQTSCSGNVIDNKEVSTVLTQNGLNYSFKRASDGVDFIFPNVETSTNGIFSEICTNLNSLSSPTGSATQKTYFTTMGISSDDCTQVNGEICVKIEKATVQGLSAIVHTKEFLRVRVSNPSNSKLGFVTQRKKITKSICGTNEVLIYQATML